MKKIFESQENEINYIINLNRVFFLDQKDYIKKYYKIRKIHSMVLNNMIDYIDKGKYPINDYLEIIKNDLFKEINTIDIEIFSQNKNDLSILNELFIYKNHEKIPSLTEIYIKNKKFKEDKKVKMLNAMNNSIVSLFKIIDFDNISGYVTYQDVWTNKKYKIIDVSMSSLGKINENKNMYIYNRIINYEDISFGTGIPCIFLNNDKKIKMIIKKCKNYSSFSKCLMFYKLVQEDNKISMKNYHNY